MNKTTGSLAQVTATASNSNSHCDCHCHALAKRRSVSLKNGLDEAVNVTDFIEFIILS